MIKHITSAFFALLFIPMNSFALDCQEARESSPDQILCEKGSKDLLKKAIGSCHIIYQSASNTLYNPICLDEHAQKIINGLSHKYKIAFSFVQESQRAGLFKKCLKKDRYDLILQCLSDKASIELTSTKVNFEDLAIDVKSIMANQYMSVQMRNEICFNSKKYSKLSVIKNAFGRITSKLPFECEPIMDAKKYTAFKTQILNIKLAKALDEKSCLSLGGCNFQKPDYNVETKFFSSVKSPQITHKYNDGFIFEPWKAELKKEDLVRKFERIKKTGAKHISFLVFICQNSGRSNNPGECNNVDNALDVRISWAKIAKSMGFTFDIIPMNYGLNPDGSWLWRGEFKPQNADLWFKNYLPIIEKITKKSKDAGAIYQVVASEMKSLHGHTMKWVGIANKLREISNRPLVMNVSWYEVPHLFWYAFDVIGISAYYPLAITRTSSAKSMARLWKVYKTKLKILSTLYSKPFQFTELGYPSADGGSIFPSNFDYSERKVDLEEQRRAFEAFRMVWGKEKDLIRVNIWATAAPFENVDMSENKTYDPFNKPAMGELEKFFKTRSSLR